MKVHSEDERQLVEYEDGNGRKFYTDAEIFIEDDLSDLLQSLPQPAQQAVKDSGAVDAFRQLSDKKKKEYLKQKISDLNRNE